MDKIPPLLDFTEANDLVCTTLARRGCSDALPSHFALQYGDGEGREEGRSVRGGRGGRGGGSGGGHGTVRQELKLNGKSVCHAWNNQRPCNGTPPTTDGCKSQSGEERLHKCSWVDNGTFCGRTTKRGNIT